uniref:dormancy-associated protein 1-like n=1 Tax=Erigeron canadensis TaxID=72917 RepID=UPI001CB8B5E9|nr:dormancy-associated protein 1-like [Erigeron canadensis]
MVLFDQMWDEVVAGPQPNRGLGPTFSTREEASSSNQGSMSMPSSPTTPGTPTNTSPTSAHAKDNVWRSVFNPGSNSATKGIGSKRFDNTKPGSPTVYDWMYSGDSRSKYR